MGSCLVLLPQKLERAEERLFYMENKHSYLQQEVARVKDMERQVGVGFKGVG